ncbi:MAG: hypothetical protein E7F83_16310 [Clostridium sp.]|uniref:hypothetical protein n=1 Tax=Clostridium TaxID=1485 RepID=UPI00232AD33A|nr:MULTISPECIES: hypothetical protein [Clostridium]MDU0894914.1 hypothetical protein [Anaerococcus sp.]MDB1931701.1 hypothetical protein [Clostridium tertium]MDB1938253.1 hypothetical protein [Clostridium tertium]MDU1566444.1 hypothetical protein [Clostridium sp.]MDU3548970.1 hypothetical protein [Clostridium sp.]
MNSLKKYLCLFLVCIISLSIPTNAFAISNSYDDMERVVIYEDEETSIVAMVPKDKAEEYKNKLASDENYKQEEIDKLNPKLRLPAGQIMYQKHMYKSDIQAAVDAYSGGGTFLQIMSFPVTGFIADKVLAKAGYSSYIGLSAALLVFAAQDLMQRREEWWKDSYIKILEGSIRCVRLSHIRNTVTDYPAAYLIIERI